MRSYKRKIPIRLIFAILLIAVSFLSSYFLSAAANRSELYWVSKSILTPGMTISSNDLTLRRAALDTFAGKYLLASNRFADFVVLNTVGAGELVPVTAISGEAQSLRRSAVPISVSSSDLPTNLAAGEMVNLFQVGDPHSASTITAPRLILKRVFILGINKRGENFGGNISLTLSVRSADILEVLGATSAGRLVVVRING